VILATLPIHILLSVGTVIVLALVFHVWYSEKAMVRSLTILTTSSIFAASLGVAIWSYRSTRPMCKPACRLFWKGLKWLSGAPPQGSARP
jgi:hypothetical protein